MMRRGVRFTPDGFRYYASPKAKQRRKCEEKTRFSSEARARAHASLFAQYVYRCRVCTFWHLTKQAPITAPEVA